MSDPSSYKSPTSIKIRIWQFPLLPFGYLKAQFDALFEGVVGLIWQDLVEHQQAQITQSKQFVWLLIAIGLALVFYNFPDFETLLLLTITLLAVMEGFLLYLDPGIGSYAGIHVDSSGELQTGSPECQQALAQAETDNCCLAIRQVQLPQAVLSNRKQVMWELYLRNKQELMLARDRNQRKVLRLQKLCQQQTGMSICTESLTSPNNRPKLSSKISGRVLVTDGCELLFALIIANILTEFGALLMFWLAPLINQAVPEISLDLSVSAVLNLLTPEADWLAISAYLMALIQFLLSYVKLHSSKEVAA